MGSVSLKIGDGTARFKGGSLSPSSLNLIMLFSVLTTNLFALYVFTFPPNPPPHPLTHNNISLISQHLSFILQQIQSSQKKLVAMEKEDVLDFQTLDPSNIPNELNLFLQNNPLPLGKDSKTGITQMVSSVAHSCKSSTQLLTQFMNYKPGKPCPDDSSLAQKLISRGCEPLPRRRCFARSVPKVGLSPFPLSLWKPLSDKILSWNGFGCKNIACLNSKVNGLDFDWANNGFEKQRWVKARGKNDFLADDVLAMGAGGIRIGLDVGGGSGNFAAVMAKKNVTIITSTLNVEAPYSEFVAARGLFPLFMTSNQRFPFSDGVFDMVHTVGGLGETTQVEKMEFLMFDIDRIIRDGGLIWLDDYYCADEESKIAVTGLIERFDYKKLRWVVGEKINTTSGKPQVYLSALLQKPRRG